MKVQILIVTLLCFSIEQTNSYHVLFVHDIGSRSHLIQMAPLVEELLNRGNYVTGIFFGSLNIQHENYTETVVPNHWKKFMDKMSKFFMEKDELSIFDSNRWMSPLNAATELLEDVSSGEFHEIEMFINSKTNIDVVITMFYSGAFFADHFDCPIILFSSAGLPSYFLHGTGNVINLSVQPSVIAPYIEPMSFGQRLHNHYINKASQIFFESLAESQRLKFGPVVRHSSEIIKERFSIFLVSSHFVTHGAWPYLPNVIEVGGLHLKEPQPLPDDLQSFMESSPKGVVYVSFGSIMKPSLMSQDKLNIFLECFKNLDMSVIWKWDGEVDNIPGNVKTVSWVPQQDLLGHPNLKVFVTHGGLGSLIEAIYHKAIIVGIPISSDQIPNMIRAEKYGYAKRLDWGSLSAQQLTASIEDAMNTENIKTSLDEIHDMYLDRENNPLEKATWWVEYVCRNKGARMLNSEVEDTPWYQYHHLDIAVFISFVLIFIIGGLVFLCLICFRCCCKQKDKTD